jgi:large subunit ribosomal protein L24
MSKWILKGDKVIVTSGNSKGQTGEVLRRNGDRVTIQGVNIGKKHAKRRTQEQKSQILEYEMPIHISNVSLCGKNDEPVKIRVRLGKEGKKELFYMQEGKEVVLRQISKGKS